MADLADDSRRRPARQQVIISNSPAIHLSLTKAMTPDTAAGNVTVVDDAVVPGDVVAGDVVTFPGRPGAVLVRMVRLGQGGFIFTVTPVGASAPQGTVTLTAGAVMRRHDHVPVS
jgi:hypothetical protein